MRTIKELIDREKKVWFYLDSEETSNAFLEDAEAEGFSFGDGIPPTEKKGVHYVIAAHEDMLLGFLSITIWCLSFMYRGKKNGVPLRVDYRRYRSEEEDYICREPHAFGCLHIGVAVQPDGCSE